MPPIPRKHKVEEASSSKAEKVKYVTRQKQTRNHRCHWPGCTRQVPPAMWGCLAHWRKLPKSLRDRVWETYRIGQEISLTPSREYLEVAREVQEWIRENHGSPRNRTGGA